jgi:transcriptional regulator with XRE-family HTH domain
MQTWATRISDLTSRGMTYAEIGERIGLAPSTVGDLASGRSKSPRGEAAIRLNDLHRERAGNPKQAARERHRPTAASAGATAEAAEVVLTRKAS